MLVVLTDLQDNYNLYWTQAKAVAASSAAAATLHSPGLAIAKGVSRAIFWKFIRKWLVQLSDKSPSYHPETDTRRGDSGRIRDGFLALKKAVSRPGSAVAGGHGAVTDCALLEQLQIIDDMPEDERFLAAYDIIRSHWPQELSYFS